MWRSQDLGDQQYGGGLSAVEKAEYDLLSALITHQDRVDANMLSMEAIRASLQRIKGLQKRFDTLKREAP